MLFTESWSFCHYSSCRVPLCVCVHFVCHFTWELTLGSLLQFCFSKWCFHEHWYFSTSIHSHFAFGPRIAGNEVILCLTFLGSKPVVALQFFVSASNAQGLWFPTSSHIPFSISLYLLTNSHPYLYEVASLCSFAWCFHS